MRFLASAPCFALVLAIAGCGTRPVAKPESHFQPGSEPPPEPPRRSRRWCAHGADAAGARGARGRDQVLRGGRQPAGARSAARDGARDACQLRHPSGYRRHGEPERHRPDAEADPQPHRAAGRHALGDGGPDHHGDAGHAVPAQLSRRLREHGARRDRDGGHRDPGGRGACRLRRAPAGAATTAHAQGGQRRQEPFLGDARAQREGHAARDRQAAARRQQRDLRAEPRADARSPRRRRAPRRSRARAARPPRRIAPPSSRPARRSRRRTRNSSSSASPSARPPR